MPTIIENSIKFRVFLACFERNNQRNDRFIIEKAEYFDKSFLPKLINPEDIYKACERRNLNRNDLERIADNLENILVDEYSILQIPYTVKYQNLAKSSTEYAEFKKIRNTDFAALHDIMALYYVREKRGKRK